MSMQRKILVVDDDETMQMILRDVLTPKGYRVHVAANGNEALKLHEEHLFPVILSDLEMPVMNGYEMISRIQKDNSDAVIIVLTVNRDPEKIIEIMKMDVYDYLMKPVDSNDLLMKVKRAFEAKELRKIKQVMDKGRHQKILEQLDWYKYTDSLSKKSYHRFDKTLFESLQINFTKGAGIGVLLTILKMIAETAEKQDDKYMIDKDLFDVVNENARIAENVINQFSEIIKIINDTVAMQGLTLHDLCRMLELLAKKLEKFTKIKGHKILLNEPKESFVFAKLEVNPEQIITAIKELLVNAMKFSPESSIIMVIIEVIDKNAEISVISTPSQQVKGVTGIPQEYERIIFEPFYRMSKDISGEYESLDYGLGLSLVEIIMQKHGGTVNAGNVRDNSIYNKKVEERVSVTLQLPLKD